MHATLALLSIISVHQPGETAVKQARAIFASALCLTWASSAPAQSSLQEIEAAIGSRSQELTRVEQLLSDPDSTRRLAAMEAILKTGDQIFMRKAKEVGLFSADPQLRQMVVKAIFDAGGPFRIDVDAPGKDATEIREFVIFHGGNIAADRTGTIQFVLPGDYDPEKNCWILAKGKCALRQTGDTVHLVDWAYGSGSFRLNESGQLEGTMLYRGKGQPVTARIPLFE